MKVPRLLRVLSLFILITAACSPPGQTLEQTSRKTSTPTPLQPDTPAPSSTVTTGPKHTATLIPSPTGTLAPEIQPLEIVEWVEYPYANLADPGNTDTRVEVRFRNPNEFPVRVDLNRVEIRLLAEDGQVVYVNPNPRLFIWEGSWMLGGETAAFSVCACFVTDGVPNQEWSLLELSAVIEPIPVIKYTKDVDVHIGDFFSPEEAHLGGDLPATRISLINASDQVLKSFEVRITARDADDQYVGVAIYGSFKDLDANRVAQDIAPGSSAEGIVVSEIDYFNEPMTYEIEAIGIPAGP